LGFELFTIAPNSQVSWGDDGTGYITAISWYHAPDGKPDTSKDISAQAWVMEIPSLKNNGHKSSAGNSNERQAKMTHEQELAKYGQITWAYNISVGVSIGALGGIAETGTIFTNKGWARDYKTIYYAPYPPYKLHV